MPTSILWLVDDDSETGAFRQAFDEEGLTVSLTSPARLEERLRQGDFDVVLATLPLKSRAIEGLSQELTRLPKGFPWFSTIPTGRFRRMRAGKAASRIARS